MRRPRGASFAVCAVNDVPVAWCFDYLAAEKRARKEVARRQQPMEVLRDGGVLLAMVRIDWRGCVVADLTVAGCAFT